MSAPTKQDLARSIVRLLCYAVPQAMPSSHMAAVCRMHRRWAIRVVEQLKNSEGLEDATLEAFLLEMEQD